MFASLGAFPWSDEAGALAFGLLTLAIAMKDWDDSRSYRRLSQTLGEPVALRIYGALLPGAVWWLSLCVVLPAAYGGASKNLAAEIVWRAVTIAALAVTLASVVMLVYVIVKGPPKRLVPPSRRN